MGQLNNILYEIRRSCQYTAVRVLGYETMSRVFFSIAMKRKLDLRNPTTFNEKIQYYKLYYCPNNELVVQCTDKLKVRDYLAAKGFGQHTVPLIGVWKTTEQMQWNELPDRFVLKCNHGCGYNILCPDKQKLSEARTKKQLATWLSQDFGYYGAEPHYNRIEKRIIGEEFLGDESGNVPIDYKVHCFHGTPEFVLVCSDRHGRKSLYNYFDLEWNPLNYSVVENDHSLFSKPPYLAEIVDISRKIAVDFPFVRVDFYIIGDRIYIGELTFVPAAGLDNTITREADYSIGELFHLNA